MKVVFFGTSDVGLPTLRALVQGHEVVAVVTSPDAIAGRRRELVSSPIAQEAGRHGLPVLKPRAVKNNPEFLTKLGALAADVFIVVSYGKILPEEVILLPRLKTLNIHFSLLPAYRGAAPIQAALLNNEKATGTSIFILDALLDHGPILLQTIEPILPDDTFITLAQRLARVSADKLIEILPSYDAGIATPIEQDHTKATRAPIIKKENGRIDWQRPAQEIYNMWRAYQPWPGIFTNWEGKLLKIIECKPVEISCALEPGTVAENGDIACGGGTSLQVLQLQLEGKQQTDFESFVRGNRKFIGSRL